MPSAPVTPPSPTPISRPEHPSGRLFAGALCLAVASVLALVPVLGPRDEASGALAGVFPPGHGTMAAYAAVAAAGGTPIRATGGGLVWVARSAEPGFAGRLRAAGAWLVLDPVVAAGCLAPSDAEARAVAAGPPPARSTPARSTPARSDMARSTTTRPTPIDRGGASEDIAG